MLFSGTDYDSISNNGYYTRLKEDEYIVWGKTEADEKRDFRYRSLIVMPGRQLKFKGKVHCSSALISAGTFLVHKTIFANKCLFERFGLKSS